MSKEKILFYEELSRNFNMFLEKCYEEIDGGQKYTETIATKLIIDKVKRLEDGNIKRLIINVPPRTLKTTIVSIAYTAWLLGRNPKIKILCISYGDDLAKDFSVKTRQVMESGWYKKAFPKTRRKIWSRRDDFFETTQNGFRKAVSLGGSLTGHGADIIIVDDPQKASEILSDKIRKSSNETFSSTIISRLNNKVEGKIVVVAQRLHMDDFSNYVQKYGEWDVLAIPAIAVRGEIYNLSDGTVITRQASSVINPELEPLDKLEEIRKGMGEYHFSAQYQQKTIPAAGNIINFKDFKFFRKEHIKTPAVVIQSWDVAVKTGEKNDYSACVTAVIFRNVVHIIDISRYKCDFPGLIKKVKQMKHKYKAQGVIIEDVGIGISLIQYLLEEGIDTLPYRPMLSKADRAAAVTYPICCGKVRLLQNASWLNDFEEEVLAFPFGKHDDQVDALVQLITCFQNGAIISPASINVSDMFDDRDPGYSDEMQDLYKWLLKDHKDINGIDGFRFRD